MITPADVAYVELLARAVAAAVLAELRGEPERHPAQPPTVETAP